MKLEGFNYELGAVMSSITVDSRQDFGKNIDVNFLRKIINRCNELDEKMQKVIESDYIWFMDSYNFKLENSTP